MTAHRLLALTALVALAGCTRTAADAPVEEPGLGTNARALFDNGGFESGVLTGWTVTTYENEELVVAPPATRADLDLQPGGTMKTKVITGAPETITAEGLSSSATLRLPRYGASTVVINELGDDNNVNSLTQTMTVTNADVDPADGKAHLRFALAPVLEDPGHPDTEQPYFWVQLRNVTRGTVLFQTFNYANQAGVPWKTSNDVLYTDWQAFDVAPGPANLAVGDVVELEAVAAGCSKGGHFGHLYVDAFGAFIPGLSLVATAPEKVNPGGLLTYNLLAKNTGPGNADGVVARFELPAQVTFHSVSGASCTTPAPGNTGTVSCALGTLNDQENHEFEVTVKVNAGATGQVSAGNYGIDADDVSPLLGPLVETTITTATLADLAITLSDGVAAAGWGNALTYTLDVTNVGATGVNGATIMNLMPPELTSASWTCAGTGGAACVPGGTGDVVVAGDLPAGGALRIEIDATLVPDPGTGSITLTNFATVAVPGGFAEADMSNNVAVDTTAVGDPSTLSLAKSGIGRGRVVSSPAVIDCGSACDSTSAEFLDGTLVSLTATAEEGHTFTGWTGGCTGQANPCTVTINGDTSVTASFTQPAFPVTGSVVGTGGTVSCQPLVGVGEDGTCTFTAAAGYTVFEVTDNGADVTSAVSGDEYVVADVQQPRSIVVKFVNPAVATSLVVSGISSPRVAGAAGTVKVEALEQHGTRAIGYTGVVAFTATDAQAALPADTTVTAADAGVVTLPIALFEVGTHTVTATDADNALTASQSNIEVTAGPAVRFAVFGLASPREAGVPGTVTIEARDAWGNTATTYTGTVTLTSTDAQASLPAPISFDTAAAGVQNASVVLKTAGTHSVTAHDAAADVSGTQHDVVVHPANAVRFVLSGLSSPRVAGVPGQATVEALDAFGNRATDYAGTVHATSSDPLATLPADFTFSGGLTTVQVLLRTAGTQTLTAADVDDITVTGTQSDIVVRAGDAKSFSVRGLTTPRAAGEFGTLVVEALDAFGNRATGYTGNVGFTSSDQQAVLPGAQTFTSAEQGLKSVSLSLNEVGTHWVQATDTVRPSLTGQQSDVVVGAGVAASFVVNVTPISEAAGVARTVTVEALDAWGNTATGYSGSATLTSTDAQATPAGAITFEAGLGTGSVALNTGGSHTVTARDATAGISGQKEGVEVTSANAVRFVVSGLASPRVAGTSGTATVEVFDAFGNRAVGYTGTVAFTSSDAQGVLPADFTFDATHAGLASVTVELRTAGTHSLTATDLGDATVTGTQSNIVVEANAAKSFSVRGLTTPREAGEFGTLQVEALDAFGNRATGYTGTVGFTSSDPQAVLPGTQTFTSGEQGLKSVSVALREVGTHWVEATDEADATLTGRQSDVEVSSSDAASLVVKVTPIADVAGSTRTVTVAALDAWGNTATGYVGTVRFSSDDTQAVLPTDVTFAALDAGLVSRPLVLKTAGVRTVGVQDIDDARLANEQTNLVVTPAAAVGFDVTGDSPVVAGEPGTVVVTARDEFGNVDTNYTGTVGFTSTDPDASLPGTYTFTTDDEGSTTFADGFVIEQAGEQAINVDSTDEPFITGTHEVEVRPASGYAVRLTGPTQATAGDTVTVSLLVIDAFGNPAPAVHPLTVSLEDTTTAVLTATTLAGATIGEASSTGLTNAAGEATVDLRNTRTEEIQVCAAVDTVDTCHTITWHAAEADHVVLTSEDEALAGGTVPVTAQVHDEFGNTVAGTFAIELSVDGDAGFDGASTIVVTTDATGAAAASLGDEHAEQVEVTVIAASVDDVALPATAPHESVSVTFVPEAADHVALTAPAEGVAGEELEITARIVDRFGNAHAIETEICVTATGDSQGQPELTAVALADAQQDDAHEVCGITDASGTGVLKLRDTKAEVVALEAQSPALAGGEDVGTEIVIHPATPDRLRLTSDATALACGDTVVQLQVTDAFDNAVPDARPVVTLTVSAEEGAAVVTGSTLDEVEDTLLGGVITGRIGEGGAATLTATLDAHAPLSVTWNSDELDAEPTVATIEFEPGAPTAEQSTVTANGTQVEAGWGSVGVNIVPVDACGVRLGDGRDVVVRPSVGDVTEVIDDGEGGYDVRFSTEPGNCPQTPSTLEVEVEGVVVGTVDIQPVCSGVAATSPVAADEFALEACASEGVTTTVSVVAMGDTGLALAPDQDVRIEGEAPFIIATATGSTTDEVTGQTTYTFEVGSNRCGPARLIPVRINGVLLDTSPTVTFRCPPVETVTVASPEPTAPADGETPIDVVVTVIDACGNPAYDRHVDLEAANATLEAEAAPPFTLTRDALGEETDGTAAFTVTSRNAGTTGLLVTVDEQGYENDALLTFTLPSVVAMTWTTRESDVIVNTPTELVATLESQSTGVVEALVLKPELEGLMVLSVEGATANDDGTWSIDSLAAGGSLEVRFEVNAPTEGLKTAALEVEYGAPFTDQRLTAAAPALELDARVSLASGGCSSSGAASLSALVLAAMLLFRRRRIARG